MLLAKLKLGQSELMSIMAGSWETTLHLFLATVISQGQTEVNPCRIANVQETICTLKTTRVVVTMWSNGGSKREGQRQKGGQKLDLC
jgi:hypothetical protein